MQRNQVHVVNQAAYRAARLRRQHTQTIILQNNLRRRRSVIFSVPPTAPLKTTSMGHEVATTFTIHESVPVDGVIQYELLVDGESVWIGMGDDRVEGLLKVIMKITGQEPDVPDN